jgi:ribosomal protein L37AE/L43A
MNKEIFIKYCCEECSCDFYLDDDSVNPWYCPLCGGNYVGQPENNAEYDD